MPIASVGSLSHYEDANADYAQFGLTSFHVRDSLVLSSFLLISVFLSRSLSLSVESCQLDHHRQHTEGKATPRTNTSPNGEIKCTVTGGGEASE